MTYNFELSISARLSAKVTEDIIKTVVEEQTGRKVASIEAKLGQEQRGMGPGATISTAFDGYQINFAPEKPQKERSSKPPFVEDRYE